MLGTGSINLSQGALVPMVLFELDPTLYSSRTELMGYASRILGSCDIFDFDESARRFHLSGPDDYMGPSRTNHKLMLSWPTCALWQTMLLPLCQPSQLVKHYPLRRYDDHAIAEHVRHRLHLHGFFTPWYIPYEYRNCHLRH